MHELLPLGLMFIEEEVFWVKLEAFETEELIRPGLTEEEATTRADDDGYKLVKVKGQVLLVSRELFGTLSIWLLGILAESGPVTCTKPVGVRIQFTGCACNVMVGKATFLLFFCFCDFFVLLTFTFSIRAWTFSVGLRVRFIDWTLFESSTLGDLDVEVVMGCAGGVCCSSARGIDDIACGGDCGGSDIFCPLSIKGCTASCMFGCVMTRLLG